MIHVLGDVFIDEYRFLKPVRLSPEAAVPICRLVRTELRPGGAGNVAANLVSLRSKGQVKLYAPLSRVDYDVIEQKLGIAVVYRGENSDLPGFRKIRYLTEDGHQFFREDGTEWFSNDAHGKILQFDLAFEYTRLDVVVVSDYAKGSIPAGARKYFAQYAQVVNCKPEQVLDYADAKLIVLNQAEAREFISCQDLHTCLLAHAVCDHIARRANKFPNVLVTCGAEGMYLAGNEALYIPAHPVPGVVDVTGAGDTVVATIAARWSATMNWQAVLEEAARNAAKVVTQVGVGVPG